MAEIAAFAARQEQQLLALDELQASLDMLKRRAGGRSSNGTIIAMVGDIFAAAIEAAYPEVHTLAGKPRSARISGFVVRLRDSPPTPLFLGCVRVVRGT